MSASDNLVWKVLDDGHCAYRYKNRTNKINFCTHKLNVDGLCKSMWCPLANSDYSTVIEEEGKIYLCQRTVERNHLPSQWWERTELDPKDIEKSRAILKDKIEFKNGRVRQRIHERFMKLVSVLKRIKAIRTDTRVELEQTHKKRERRWNRREKKALVAAHLETEIEEELLKRLNNGVYGEMYQELLENEEEEEEERERELEQEKEYEGKENDFEKIAFDMDFDNDIEDIINKYNKRLRKDENGKTKKRRKIEKETEQETDKNEELELNF